MDGNTIELDPRTAEAMRQDRVYQQAMAALRREKQQAQTLEDAALAPALMLSNAARKNTKTGKMIGWVKFLLVALAGGIINLLFYAEFLA